MSETEATRQHERFNQRRRRDWRTGFGVAAPFTLLAWLLSIPSSSSNPFSWLGLYIFVAVGMTTAISIRRDWPHP